MDLKEHRILELKIKRNILHDEIKLKNKEIESVNKELLSLEWVRFSWYQLEAWLEENRHLKEITFGELGAFSLLKYVNIAVL